MWRSAEWILKRTVIGILRPFAARTAVPLPAGAVPPPRSILIIRQHNQLGDMLCVVPLLRMLREKYPSASIALLTSPVNFEVMRGNRYLESVLLYEKRDFLRRAGLRVGALLRYVRDLRRRGFDMVIVPATVSVSFTSDLLAFLSGASIRLGASSLDGNDNPSGYVYSHPVALDWRSEPHRHQVLRNADVARPLGFGEPSVLSLEMTLTEKEHQEGSRFLAQFREKGMRVIAVHPGAGKVPNRWPAERFADVMDALGQAGGTEFLITSGPMDDTPVSTLCSLLRVPYVLIKNQPIRKVAAILSGVDLLLSNDTGIMHVGAAAGARVLSLFGPTDPCQWAPMGSCHRWLRGEGGNIEEIRVDEVLSVVRAMMGEEPTASEVRNA